MRRVSITNLGPRAARDRADVLRRARARVRRRRTPPTRPSPTSSSRPSSLPELGALLATRRPRSRDGAAVWAAHVVVRRGARPAGGAQYETDRARFLGRGRSIRTPMSVDRRAAPVEHRGLGARSDLQPATPGAPRARARAPASSSPRSSPRSREAAVALADKYRDPATFERTVDPRLDAGAGPAAPPRASTRTRRTSSRTWRAGSSTPTRRCAPPPDVLRGTRAGPSALWAHGISGDLPIVLVRIDEPEDRGDRAPAPPRPRVLAHEGARRRPRHPERAGPTPTPRSSRPRWRRCVRDEPVRAAARADRAAGSVFILREGSALRRRSRLPCRRPRGSSS